MPNREFFIAVVATVATVAAAVFGWLAYRATQADLMAVVTTSPYSLPPDARIALNRLANIMRGLEDSTGVEAFAFDLDATALRWAASFDEVHRIELSNQGHHTSENVELRVSGGNAIRIQKSDDESIYVRSGRIDIGQVRPGERVLLWAWTSGYDSNVQILQATGRTKVLRSEMVSGWRLAFVHALDTFSLAIAIVLVGLLTGVGRVILSRLGSKKRAMEETSEWPPF